MDSVHPLRSAAVLAAARTSGPDDHALVCLLGMLGPRVFEASATDITDLRYEALRLRAAAHPRQEEPSRPTSRCRTRCCARPGKPGATAPPARSCGPARAGGWDRAGASRALTRVAHAAGITRPISPQGTAYAGRSRFCQGLVVQNSVISLRRYPVKSMGGEAIDVAELDARGFAGDRWYAVEDDQGHFASGKDTRRFRRRDAAFSYAAHTEPDGRVVVTRDGHRWLVGDPDLDKQLTAEMGTAVRITPEADVPHQDAGSVSIISTATLGWCADRWGGSSDARRLRANIVIDADEPFCEERWLHQEVQLGAARLRVVDRAQRCRTMDIRQDGADPGARWLKALSRERDMVLAVYAAVTHPGNIRVGDQPQLVSVDPSSVDGTLTR